MNGLMDIALISCSLLEKAMAPHSSTLAWEIPWAEEPGRLQSMGSLSPTRLSNFTFTFHFHALEKEMATHSSVLAWRAPGMGEPGGLPSMGLQRVGHDWSDLAAAATSLQGWLWIRHSWSKHFSVFVFIFNLLRLRSSCLFQSYISLNL